MSPRIRIGHSLLQSRYRGHLSMLHKEGGWWVCTIDDTTHAGHTAIGALKGWFSVWDHHSPRAMFGPGSCLPIRYRDSRGS